MPIVHLSPQVLLAMEAVTALALEARVKGPEVMTPEPRLERALNLKDRALEKTLTYMVRAGILSAEDGHEGGYRLACPPRSITLQRVAEAVAKKEQPFSHVTQLIRGSALSQTVVVPRIDAMLEGWSADCREINIEDLMNDARRAGILDLGTLG